MKRLALGLCCLFLSALALDVTQGFHHEHRHGRVHGRRMRHKRHPPRIARALASLREEHGLTSSPVDVEMPTQYHRRLRHPSTHGNGANLLQSQDGRAVPLTTQAAPSLPNVPLKPQPALPLPNASGDSGDLQAEKFSFWQKLQQGYSIDEPPRNRPDSHVDMAIAFVANKLVELNAVERTMTIVGWVRQFWYDPRLAFDGANNISKHWDAQQDFLLVHSSDLWIPDTTLLNSVDFNWGEMCDNDVFAFVYEDSGIKSKSVNVDGIRRTYTNTFSSSLHDHKMKFNVMWSRPCVFKTKCDISLQMYPFDTNVCPLTFQPWGDNFINMYVATQSLSSQVSLPEFAVKILNATSELSLYTVPTGATWPCVNVNLQIARHGHYYVVNIICPIVMLVMLTWFALWIPLGATDRVAAMFTLVLTVMAAQAINAEKRPATDKDMWLDEFQTSALLLVIGAAVYTVWYARFQPEDDWDEHRIATRNAVLRVVDRLAVLLFPAISFLTFGTLFWKVYMYEQTDGHGQKNFSGRATVLVIIFCVVTTLMMCVGIMSHWFPELMAGNKRLDDISSGLHARAKHLDQRAQSTYTLPSNAEDNEAESPTEPRRQVRRDSVGGGTRRAATDRWN